MQLSTCLWITALFLWFFFGVWIELSLQQYKPIRIRPGQAASGKFHQPPCMFRVNCVIVSREPNMSVWHSPGAWRSWEDGLVGKHPQKYPPHDWHPRHNVPPNDWHSENCIFLPFRESMGAWRSWEGELVRKHPRNYRPNDWQSNSFVHRMNGSLKWKLLPCVFEGSAFGFRVNGTPKNFHRFFDLAVKKIGLVKKMTNPDFYQKVFL